MPAPRFRGTYDSLTKIAQGFAQHASRASQTKRSRTQSMNTLRGGDWSGKGATAFYKEMEGEVMPAMIRLAKALEASDRVTRQIGKQIKQAEDDASRPVPRERPRGMHRAGGDWGDAMEGLLEAEPPGAAYAFLLIIADLRGRPVEEMRSEFGKF